MKRFRSWITTHRRRSIAVAKLRVHSLACIAVAIAAIAVVVFEGSVFAQNDNSASTPLSTSGTGCKSASNSSDAVTEIDRFRCLATEQQAASLRMQIENHSLAEMTDEQLIALMDAMKPDAFVEYLRSDMLPDDSYAYTMFREERIAGKWPDRPDHMSIRYQDEPRRVYAKWLPDGAHAGQEILYDETVDPHDVLGHLGGKLRILAGKVSIDGPFSRAQSRHSVRDLGLQFIARTVDHDARRFREEGLSEKPTRVEVLTVHGMRMLAWTWIAPAGPPAHYAARVRLLFDLDHTWPWGEAAWNERGELQERIHFEDVVPHRWNESTFDRRNPEYGFR